VGSKEQSSAVKCLCSKTLNLRQSPKLSQAQTVAAMSLQNLDFVVIIKIFKIDAQRPRSGMPHFHSKLPLSL
jgi:hypothetical protein